MIKSFQGSRNAVTVKEQGSIPHALIISDPGVLMTCREVFPGILCI
jgi:collagenase-like PrtC family protease